MATLPTEILFKIIDTIPHDTKALLACSLACTSFQYQCQKHLFSSPIFSVDATLVKQSWDNEQDDSGSESEESETSWTINCSSRSLPQGYLDTTLKITQELTNDEIGVFQRRRALDRLYEALTGPDGERLASYIQSFTVYLRPITSPLMFGFGLFPDTWKRMGQDIIHQLPAIVRLLPSLKTLRIFNHLPMVNNRPVDAQPTIEAIVSPSFSDLSLSRVSTPIPIGIRRQLERLYLEDWRVVGSGTGGDDNSGDTSYPRLRDLIFIGNFSGGYLERVVSTPTDGLYTFPLLQHFLFQSQSSPFQDEFTASQILKGHVGNGQLKSFRIPWTSNYYSASMDPVMDFTNFQFPDFLPCLAFDVDLLLPYVYDVLAGRIAILAGMLNKGGQIDMDELEFNFRFQRYSDPSSKHTGRDLENPFEGDFSRDTLGWARLKEAIYLRFAGKLKKVRLLFKVYGCGSLDIHDSGSAVVLEQLRADKSKTVGYLKNLFAPLAAHQISTEVQYDLVPVCFEDINHRFK